jgi:hypothetical protein
MDADLPAFPSLPVRAVLCRWMRRRERDSEGERERGREGERERGSV